MLVQYDLPQPGLGRAEGAGGEHMRIGFLMGPNAPADRSLMPEVAAFLTDRGAVVEPIRVSERLIDVFGVRAEHDLYVLKDKSDVAMSIAASLHEAGAAVLNPYPVSAMLRDRILTFRVLQSAGVPMPQTFVASHLEQLRPAVEQGPLIVKSYRRPSGADVAVVRSAAELAALPPVGEPVFAQRYHPRDGRDRKLYLIGAEVFGVTRVWPARTYEEKLGEPFTPSPELADLARRCGAAFGIDLCGVDIVENDGHAYVVNVSSLPGFKGVPDAARRVAEYIYTAAERVAVGAPLLPAAAEPLHLPREPGAHDGPAPVRSATPHLTTEPTRHATRTGQRRVALYSPGMVGFGHIRRNASIAQALLGSDPQPVIVMIAEARQIGSLPMPAGVDYVTLPALRKEADGSRRPRFLNVSDQDLVALRESVIRSAIEAFEPDVMIVDHLPLGAARELTRTLDQVRERGATRCVLGLRDVLQDPATVRRTWAEQGHAEVIRDYYDAVWIYGDPAVYDPVREYGTFDQAAAKVRYTGYLDERPRLRFAAAQADSLLATLPPGKLALCVVGGGQDGAALAEAFVQADLPPDTIGVVVTGLYMPEETRERLRRWAERRPRLTVFEFLSEPAALIQRADRVVSMGGYNTVCEVLSFEKHALIVPRVNPNIEQWIRAQRLRDLGLVDVLHPDQLSPRALTEWLARDLGPPPASRSRVDLGGLTRIPGLLEELLSACRSPVQQAVTLSA